MVEARLVDRLIEVLWGLLHWLIGDDDAGLEVGWQVAMVLVLLSELGGVV